jgi:hypothetical protein
VGEKAMGVAQQTKARLIMPNQTDPCQTQTIFGSGGIIELFHKERHPRAQSLNVPSKELLRTEKLLFIFAALQEFALFFLHSSQ